MNTTYVLAWILSGFGAVLILFSLFLAATYAEAYITLAGGVTLMSVAYFLFRRYFECAYRVSDRLMRR